MLRLRLIKWCIAADAFGKVRICDIVSTESDEVTASFGDKAGAVLCVDPGVQDERSRIDAPKVMHDRVTAHVLNGRAGKVGICRIRSMCDSL